MSKSRDADRFARRLERVLAQAARQTAIAAASDLRRVALRRLSRRSAEAVASGVSVVPTREGDPGLSISFGDAAHAFSEGIVPHSIRFHMLGRGAKIAKDGTLYRDVPMQDERGGGLRWRRMSSKRPGWNHPGTPGRSDILEGLGKVRSRVVEAARVAIARAAKEDLG